MKFATIALAAALGCSGEPSRAARGADAAVPAPRVISKSHDAMGTRTTISVWHHDEAAAGEAIDEAFAELDRIEKLMTSWTDDSDVARVNAAAGSGQPISVDPEVVVVMEKAAESSRLSHGAFDVTVGAFFGVWKFDQDRDGTIPDPKLVEERRLLVNWRELVIDRERHTARLARAGQKINLGGIAKGYAVDREVAILRRHGFADFLVQAGGDLYVAGKRGDRHWRVGIRDPRASRDEYFAMAEIQDRSFSTSGDYERFVIRDGKRYHHIIDPATGYPATRTRSVTVMALDAFTADALSKGFFILGPEEGMKLVEQLPDVEAVFVGADNQVHVSSGLRGKVTILHPPTDGL